MVTEASRERLRLAKEVSLIGLIKDLGYTLEDSGTYLRMKSPFRAENNPSFNIDKRRPNKFVDYGGIKGDPIDFVQELFHLSKGDAINYLLEKRKIAIPVYEPIVRDHKSIEITHVGDIISPSLIDYLTERQITLKTAQKWLVELEIKFPYGKYPDRTTKVLGFKSDSGGYEMRSKFMKVCNSPKNVTTIKGEQSDSLLLFEGFFSFLSYAQRRDTELMPYDTVVLNSLSFLPTMLSFWDKELFIYSYLDNDTAGDKATQMIKESGLRFVDMRYTYQGYNDLNDMLTGKKNPVKVSKLFKI
jgi:hypothetical protein